MKYNKLGHTVALKHDIPIWVCPRCRVEQKVSNYPAISRRDNITEICSACGTDEAMFDFSLHYSNLNHADKILKQKEELSWIANLRGI